MDIVDLRAGINRLRRNPFLQYSYDGRVDLGLMCANGCFHMEICLNREDLVRGRGTHNGCRVCWQREETGYYHPARPKK